ELSRNIQGLQSREPWDYAFAFEPFAVTLRTRHRLPGLSAFGQGFASGDTARRHVGDETGMRIADFRAVRIFGNLQDTSSNRLGAPLRMQNAMTSRGGDERLRRRGGLDDLHPHRGLQRSEVLCGLANVLVRHDLRDGTHAGVVLARARLVVRHLPD